MGAADANVIEVELNPAAVTDSQSPPSQYIKKDTREDTKEDTREDTRETPKMVEDAARMASSVAARATFMAGFTYYQIGRYRYTPTVSYAESEDILYIVFNTLSFQISVLVAILGFSFNYYLNRTKNKHSFCLANITITRFLYQLLCFASINYLLGLGRLGFVYYPGGYMKLCPMYMMCFFTLLLWMSYTYIPRIGERLHTVGTNADDLEGHMHVIDEIVNNSEYRDFKRGEGEDLYEDTLAAQCGTISGRAIFIAGLGQQGMLRFMANSGLNYGMGAWIPSENSPEPGGTPHFAYDDLPANSFIFFATLATGLAFVSGFVLTALEIWLRDASKKKQLAFAILITPLARTAFACYSLSLCSVSGMLILTGYGTNAPKVIYLVFGSVSAATMVAGFFYALSKYRKVQFGRDDDQMKDISVCPIEVQVQFANLMQKTHNAGGMATFAVGYGIYNVVTMNSDVMYMQPDETLFQFYIAMNAFSVIAGLNCIIYDSFISIMANELSDQKKRVRFGFEISWMASFCDFNYKASLATWLGVFGMYGQIKMWDQTVTPHRYTYVWSTYWYTGTAAVIIFVVDVFMTRSYHQVFKLRWLGSKESTEAAQNTAVPQGFPDGDLTLTRELKRQASMNVVAAGVLFLGGYAYFAGDFYKKVADWQTQSKIDWYMHTLSICFSASIAVLYWSSDYNSSMSQLPSDRLRYIFSSRVWYVYYFTLAAAVTTVFSILLAVMLLGDMKNNSYNPPNKYEMIDQSVQPVASCSLAIIIAAFGYLCPVFYRLRRRELKNDTFDGEKEKGYAKFEAQIGMHIVTAGFVAGNTCYEMMFSDAIAPKEWVNYYYFIMTAGAFSLAVASASLSVLTRVCIGGLGTEKGRRVFTAKVRHMQSIVFNLSNAALFCWMTACIAMGYTKYQAPKPQQWQPSFYITLACTALLFGIYPFMVKEPPALADALREAQKTKAYVWQKISSCWFWVWFLSLSGSFLMTFVGILLQICAPDHKLHW